MTLKKLPLPPVKLTPAITGAAIAGMSHSTANRAETNPILAERTYPAKAAKNPEIMKEMILIRSTEIPIALQACLLPPTRYNLLPVTVRLANMIATMTTNIKNKTSKGIGPKNTLPNNIHASGSPAFASPRVIIRTMPPSIHHIATVWTNDGILSFVIINPFTNPIPHPIKSVTKIAAGTGKPASHKSIPAMGENAATATIERSISPTNMTNVMPMERRHTVVPCTNTFEKIADENTAGTKMPVAR